MVSSQPSLNSSVWACMSFTGPHGFSPFTPVTHTVHRQACLETLIQSSVWVCVWSARVSTWYRIQLRARIWNKWRVERCALNTFFLVRVQEKTKELLCLWLVSTLVKNTSPVICPKVKTWMNHMWKHYAKVMRPQAQRMLLSPATRWTRSSQFYYSCKQCSSTAHKWAGGLQEIPPA